MAWLLKLKLKVSHLLKLKVKHKILEVIITFSTSANVCNILWVMSHSIVLCSVFIVLMYSKTLKGQLTTKLGAYGNILNLYLMNLLSQIYFLTPWTIFNGSKGNFERNWKEQNFQNQRGTKIRVHAFHINLCFDGKWKKQKLERTHPPNLVHMHFTSTFTCMNFLSRFSFLTPWTIMSMVWKWNLKDKRSKTYETQETLHMKLCIPFFTHA